MRSVTRAVWACILLPAFCTACTEDTVAAASQSPPTGEQLLEEMAQAYRSAPAFTDAMRVEVRMGRERRTDLRDVAVGSGTDVRLVIDGFEFTVVNDQVYIVRADHPGKYFVTPLAGNLVETYKGLTGGMALPVPQLAFRYGRGPEDYVRSFGMQAVANLKLAGRDTVSHDGRSMEQLRFSGDGGATVTALVDPQTRFLERLELSGGRVEMTAGMSPQRLDRLPEAIGFDTAGRRRVETLQSVLRLGKGDPAPDFTLPTLAGERVTLSSHRGSMVVLDFWATWCGPCRLGLPKLQQFDDWARQEGLAVEVIPVNIAERHPTREAKKKSVQQYWEDQGFKMQTLIDYDNASARAFDVGPIPHTVVVGPDGIIRHVTVGFDPAQAKKLKELTRELEIPRRAP